MNACLFAWAESLVSADHGVASGEATGLDRVGIVGVDYSQN